MIFESDIIDIFLFSKFMFVSVLEVAYFYLPIFFLE